MITLDKECEEIKHRLQQLNISANHMDRFKLVEEVINLTADTVNTLERLQVSNNNRQKLIDAYESYFASSGKQKPTP